MFDAKTRDFHRAFLRLALVLERDLSILKNNSPLQVSEQLALLRQRAILQEILRIAPDIHLIRFHPLAFVMHSRSELIVPEDLLLNELPRTELVEADVLKECEQLLNQTIFSYIRVLALAVFRFAAGVIDVEVNTSIGKAFLFFLRRDARAAYTAHHELGEGEILELFLGTVLFIELLLHGFKQLSRNKCMVLAGIPRAAPFRIFEDAEVYGIAEQIVHIAET